MNDTEITLMQCAYYLLMESPLVPYIEIDRTDVEVVTDGVAYLMDRIRHYWLCWTQHPDFEWCQKECPGHECNPIVVCVFKSDDCLKDRPHSFVIAGLSDVTSPHTMRWAARTLGEFVCILPIRVDIPVQPYRIQYISNSLKGCGKAFRARMALKEMLPPSLRPLVAQARTQARKPKWFYLTPDDLVDRRARKYPDWYKQTTKDKLARQRFFEDAGPDVVRRLSIYIAPENFWRAATGKVHPDDVPALFTQQLRLL